MVMVSPRRHRAAVFGGAVGGLCRGAAPVAVLLVLLGTSAAIAAATAGASNSATLTKERDIRAKLAAAGFSDIVNLQEREGGAWSGRALRFDTAVRVEVDRDGKISVM